MIVSKERANRILPILQAYVEGKPLQAMYLSGGYNARYEDWYDNADLDFKNYAYRIKQEPKLRPYTFEEMCEAVKKHGAMIKSKGINEVFTITGFDECNTFYGVEVRESYEEFMKYNVWFDDGTPCGIMEE